MTERSTRVMVTVTLVGGPAVWPSLTTTIGLFDRTALPADIAKEAARLTLVLLQRDGTDEPDLEPEPETVGLGL